MQGSEEAILRHLAILMRSSTTNSINKIFVLIMLRANQVNYTISIMSQMSYYFCAARVGAYISNEFSHAKIKLCAAMDSGKSNLLTYFCTVCKAILDQVLFNLKLEFVYSFVLDHFMCCMNHGHIV